MERTFDSLFVKKSKHPLSFKNVRFSSIFDHNFLKSSIIYQTNPLFTMHTHINTTNVFFLTNCNLYRETQQKHYIGVLSCQRDIVNTQFCITFIQKTSVWVHVYLSYSFTDNCSKFRAPRKHFFSPNYNPYSNPNLTKIPLPKP